MPMEKLYPLKEVRLFLKKKKLHFLSRKQNLQDKFSMKKLVCSEPRKERLFYLYTNSIARTARFIFLSSLICLYAYLKYLLSVDEALLNI